MVERKEDLSILSDITLLKLYEHGSNIGGLLSINDLVSSFETSVTSTFLRHALEIITKRDHVDFFTISDGRYEISARGIVYVQEFLADSSSMIARYKKFGDSWLDDDIESPEDSRQEDIPASDRVVSKSDNQPEFDEAKSAVYEVIATLEEDESLDNILGEEKGPLLQVLKSGQELFETGRINVSVAIMYNLEPLKNFVERYKNQIVNATIFAVVNTAILALSTLLGVL